jgi:hypothetical protein
MKPDFDRTKSLQELEGEDWGEPTYDSHLVKACHNLRRKPLIEFTVEDLRTMIGQSIGLIYLVPIALDRLETEPLAEGDFCPGDLLTAVLRVDEQFWVSNRDLLQRFGKIVQTIKESLPSLDEVDRRALLEALEQAKV